MATGVPEIKVINVGGDYLLVLVLPVLFADELQQRWWQFAMQAMPRDNPRNMLLTNGNEKVVLEEQGGSGAKTMLLA
jgi:hypothetical protein